MKEVIAIIRRHNLQETKAGLLGIGVPALTMVSVEGRGKQKGLPGWNYELDPALMELEEKNTGVSMRFIPKRMISTVVEDEDVPLVRFGFPVYDRVGEYRYPIMGYNGSIYLLDQMTNAILGHKYDPNKLHQ